MKAGAIAVALLAAGCAARGPVYSSGGNAMPSGYQAGMQAGCSSGYVAAGHPYHRFTKDPERYGRDAMYKQGWDDGMVKCKGEYEAIGRALR